MDLFAVQIWPCSRSTTQQLTEGGGGRSRSGSTTANDLHGKKQRSQDQRASQQIIVKILNYSTLQTEMGSTVPNNGGCAISSTSKSTSRRGCRCTVTGAAPGDGRRGGAKEKSEKEEDKTLTPGKRDVAGI